MVHAEGERHHAAPAKSAIGRLQPDDSGIGRRQPDRAAGIGAHRQRQQPGRHRRAGAGRRSAREILRVPGIEGAGERQFGTGCAGGELMGRELAREHHAGAVQPLGRVRVGEHHVLQHHARMAGRAQPSRVIQILQPVRDAVQRAAASAGPDFPLRRAGRVERGVSRHLDEGVQGRVMPGDPVERRLRQFHRRQRARRDRLGSLGQTG